jgi:hypothetical protein
MSFIPTMSPLYNDLIMKPKSYVVQEDHQLALMYDGDGTAVEYTPPPPQSEKKKKNKKEKKPKVSAADTAPVKKQVEQQGEQRKKTSFAQQWPHGKIYLNKSGNNLTKECNDWFRGFCFKCGFDSLLHLLLGIPYSL